MRTKHGLIDFDDVYVKPNVWRQLGQTGRWRMSPPTAATSRSTVVAPKVGRYVRSEVCATARLDPEWKHRNWISGHSTPT